MTRRTFLVPLFAAAFILAPAELSGTIEGQAQGLLLRCDRSRPAAGPQSVVGAGATLVVALDLATPVA